MPVRERLEQQMILNKTYFKYCTQSWVYYRKGVKQWKQMTLTKKDLFHMHWPPF